MLTHRGSHTQPSKAASCDPSPYPRDGRKSSHYPKIDVLFWNKANAYVMCPACERIHMHGTRLPGFRVSHCEGEEWCNYEFRYPVDEEKGFCAYEINKRKALFVKVGVEDSKIAEKFPEPRPVQGIRQGPRPGMNLRKDAKELTATAETEDMGLDEPCERMCYALMKCIDGDVRAVEKYLKTSTERELFLYGRKETGDTVLIMAAAERHPEMLSLLLEHKADVNASNDHGRTPLMEAALWGRLISARALLKAQADHSLRDYEGRSASDLAQPTAKNKQERYLRSEEAAEHDVHACDRNRKQITIMLGPIVETERRYTGPGTGTALENYVFKKSPEKHTITLHGPIRTYQVRRISQTAAELDRGIQFVRISATSGWRHDALPMDVAGEPSWIVRVFSIANEVGHKLPYHEYDQGWRGRYHASHAEKKLIAYFVNKHVFTEEDRTYSSDVQKALEDVRNSLEGAKKTSDAWAKVCDTEIQQRKLNMDYLNTCYKGEKDDDEQLSKAITNTTEMLKELEADSEVAAMRALQVREAEMLRREQQEEHLMELSENMPSVSLKHVIILSSNEVCKDCEMFTQAVNLHFDLKIELKWCV